jgi:hypothetical protein
MAFSDISMQILRQGLHKTKGFSGAASACPAPVLSPPFPTTGLQQLIQL